MSRIRALVIFSLAILAQCGMTRPAFAQDPQKPDLLTWVKDHSSIVSGVALANQEHTEYISLDLAVDFEIKPRLRGFGHLSLFGRQRVDGESIETPGIPLSLEDLALYSAGELAGGFYFEWTPKVGIECRGGVSFQMISLTGMKGDPVDPSKFMGACGPRITGGPGRLSVLFGHYGAVDEGEKFWGFVPSMVFDGEFKFTESVDFVVFVASGRDLTTQLAVTTARFGLRKQF